MNIIRDIRLALELTQNALAHELGVTQGIISHYEKGRRRPHIETAKLIVDYATKHGLHYTLENIYPQTLAREH